MTRPDEFLTVREVAEVLTLSTQRVYQIIKTGGLLATRFGRRGQVLLVTTTALDEYLAAHPRER